MSTRLLEADERLAKATLFGLNQTGRRIREWEEAWIVHALVREDGLTQVEVAELLGRHKTWVCRRLALVEQLALKQARFWPCASESVAPRTGTDGRSGRPCASHVFTT